ncbi:MAG: sialidase family protein [Gammaproteobacteria bacterium]
MPRLTTDGTGEVWLSWVEPAGGGHALKYARLEPDGWSDPAEAARGTDWFINWADFPSVVSAGDGRLGAHWLEKREGGPYAYHVMMSVSTDSGRTWSPPASPHDDESATEHGFATLLPTDAGLAAVWLDGRNTSAPGVDAPKGHQGHGGAMTLRAGGLGWNAQPLAELQLDTMTCDCCQTGAAATEGGVVVVYRDRSPQEIRDIAFTLLKDGRATAPRPVAEDNWHMPACPVNGPAIAASGDRVAVAWFTAPGERPAVKLAVSPDGGKSFGEPVTVESGPSLGRVDVAFLADGRPVVSWLALKDKKAEIRYRIVSAEDAAGEIHSLAKTSRARSSGFPQMAVSGQHLVFAWTAAGDPSRVLSARVPVPSSGP